MILKGFIEWYTNKEEEEEKKKRSIRELLRVPIVR